MLNNGVRIPVRVEGNAHTTTHPLVTEPETSINHQETGQAQVRRNRQNDQVIQDGVDWKSVAARLQADMVNFRKRQEKRADDEAQREKQRLLREFLEIVDQFEAILAHASPQDGSYKAMQMTYNAMMSILKREGVERMPDVGTAFDPAYHEAVAQVRPDRKDLEQVTIADVVRAGYLMSGQLLRPARVVVAVP